MDSLTAIAERNELHLPAFGLDRFQEEILKRLHLEFFFAKCRVLISPHLRYSATGETNREEEDRLKSILDEKQELIEQLKRYLVYNLSLYSGLLEANSYNIALNNYLLISRFVDFGAHPGVYEVKLYTLSQEDLIAHYSDKIYLGRDFISDTRLDRDHFGIAFIRDSLAQQFSKLRDRVERLGSDAERDLLGRELLPDLEESLQDFAAEVGALMGSCPAHVSADGRDKEELREVNTRFREMKHTLAEAETSLREVEQKLIAESSDVARYVTKFRQDITNDVDYIMVKVNGRISDAVNGIRL